MTSYRRFIGVMPPPPLRGAATPPAGFAPLIVDAPRREAKRRHEAAAVDCTAEGGRA
jgi:hypothetical protein